MTVLSETQQQIFDWLDNRLELPVYADAYRGAALSLKDRSPGYITFVSHVARDLMNFLARTVAGIRSSQVDYRHLVGKLQQKWRNEWGGQGLFTAEQRGEGHLIPYNVCEMIANLINKHKEGSLRNQQADDFFFNTFLGYSDKDRIPSMKKWKETKVFFRANTHLREPAFSENVHINVAENFKILEDFLFVAATSEYSRIGTLDAILEETNT